MQVLIMVQSSNDLLGSQIKFGTTELKHIYGAIFSQMISSLIPRYVLPGLNVYTQTQSDLLKLLLVLIAKDLP